MRLHLTKYGWPQVAVFPTIALAIMLICPLAGPVIGVPLPLWAIILIEIPLAVAFIWFLMFFRDPYRRCPSDEDILLAPADGQITDIELVHEDRFIGAKALRIGIFLSIFDVHINRSPCNAKVERITRRKGRYKNAKNPQSSRTNESNDIGLVRTDSPKDRLLVRQISGAIARCVVCRIATGQQLHTGEKFGMIKFGSRTELYVTTRQDVKCLVQIGDKVKAGLTPLIRYDGNTQCKT